MAGKHLFLLGILVLGISYCSGQVWNNWAEWVDCSVTCGTGTTHRTRTCAGPNFCSGETREDKPCTQGNECMWSEWEAYGGCSVSCGTGVLTRIRQCENGTSDPSTCTGERNMTLTCALPACPTWNTWQEWSACPVSCGTRGVIQRVRTCNVTGQCVGNSTETGPCNPLPQQPCPAEWTNWVEQSCSVSCGSGTKIRTRSCPPPYGCPGLSQDTISCSQPACQVPVTTPAPTPAPTPSGNGSWSNWSAWSSCPQSCARRRSKRTRTRTCEASNCRGRPQQRRRCPRSKNCGGGNRRGGNRCQGARCRSRN